MKLNFDVLYIHSPEICLPFLFFNKRSPVIYHQHGFSNALHSSKFFYGEAQIFRKFFDFAMWIIYKKASWIIAIDSIGIQQAKRAGAGQKTSLMLNAVDTQRFSFDKRIRDETRNKLGLSEKDFVIFNAGRIEKQKGLQRLLECIPLLKKKDLQFHIFIAGDGSYKTKLTEIVKNHNYDHLVTFLGRVDHELLPKYYNMADVFVLPSEKEGVPMAILESIACGTPVVANRVGGIPEFLNDGINGMLLNDLSPATIAATILHVYKSQFDRDVVANTVEKLSSRNAIISLLNIVHRIAVK
jgi:glycosyltransferase involved in cell wall biosynthesis